MQPTLNGITFHPPHRGRFWITIRFAWVNTALFGKYPVQIRALSPAGLYLGYGNDSYI
jgi:hypothetical protein